MAATRVAIQEGPIAEDRSDLSSQTLGQEHFLPIALNGWGDGWNAYVHSMSWFNDRLYCGTFRANLCLKKRQTFRPPQWPVWPIQCPPDAFADIDLRAQIWRYDPRAARWDLVQRAPIVTGRDGRDIIREVSYRGMRVFRGRSDAAPALYVSTFANTRAPGPMILRSEDGETFTPASKPGLGLDGVSSFRFLMEFNGRLYTSPVGSNNNVANQSKYPYVLESADPAKGEWRQVSPPGFGDPYNTVVFNVVAFNDHLYAGTFNHLTGFQVWKTRGVGEAPYRWTKVLDIGAYRGHLNQGVLSFCVFKDALYIGTAIQDGGYDRVNQVGPAAGEVIRLYPDDSWELVVGTPRLTPKGVVLPKSGFYPGFNDLFNGYMWRMAVHAGRLYMGTASWGSFLPYLNRSVWPGHFRELIEFMGVDEAHEREGGCDLWSTADGDNWMPVTIGGFGNPYNCGIRSFASTPYGLAVGSVNPFGPTVAVRRGSEWEYVDNPRGGAEVWLGAPELKPHIRAARPAGAVQPSAEAYRLAPLDPPPYRKPVRPGGGAEAMATAGVLDRKPVTEIAERADIGRKAPHMLALARRVCRPETEGLDNVPSNGRLLVVANNPAAPTPFGAVSVPDHALLALDALHRHRPDRPPLFLAPPDCLADPNRRISAEAAAELGLVPATLENGRALLDLDRAVLTMPEAGPSVPPYRMRPFTEDFALMAWLADAPIVPAVVLGSHEAHFVIDYRGHQTIINKGKPRPVAYTVAFLPPIRVRDRVPDAEDRAAVRAFCEELRERMQREIDRRVAGRHLVGIAERLQRRFGDTAPPSTPSSPIKTTH